MKCLRPQFGAYVRPRSDSENMNRFLQLIVNNFKWIVFGNFSLSTFNYPLKIPTQTKP